MNHRHRHDRLTLRNDPAIQRRDLTSRTMQMRAATLNEQERSVEVVMSTEGVVQVYDWERGIIDEVLVSRGGEFPEQLPFLENHYRWSTENVLGSVRGIRQEGGKWIGRAFFAEGDKQADAAWNKTRQGHLTDVSVGYRAIEFTDIPAGGRQLVAGREYTAGRRVLRVTTRWEAKELSLVPIGADRDAKVRSNDAPGDSGRKVPMKPQLRKYLESLGLRHDASLDDAKAFYAALGGAFRQRADAIDAGSMTLEQATAAPARSREGRRADGEEGDDEDEPPAGDEDEEREFPDEEEEERSAADITTRGEGGRRGQRRATGADRGRSAPRRQPAGANSEEVLRAERDRVQRIRQLAGDDTPRELVQRAESEGWSTGRASRAFLTNLRDSRSASVRSDAPGGIVRHHDRDCTGRTLGLALAIRSGMSDQQIQRSVQRILGRGEKWENVADQADRYRDMSLFDVCREAIRLDGGTAGVTRDETIRAAVSGGNLTNIFTTSVNAVLMVAYVEEEDTTVGWVQEVDVADFKTMDEIDATANARLERLGRGGTARDADLEDTKESWKIFRMAKKMSVDEQDIIDDNMGILIDSARALGEAGRKVRPDLVYSMLLSNPTLAADNSVVFHTANHGNLGTGGGSALQSSSLKTGVTAMGKQTKGTDKNVKNLNIKPRFLIVPQDLKFTAMELLNSATIFKATGSDTTVEFGSSNPLSAENLELRVDNRIGAAGVLDPTTDTVRTGTATNWFLAAAPQGRTMKVGYLRGTGRAPQIRPYTLDKGQWGVGWDVKLDIGATFLDYRGFYKSNGA